jgi:ParB/RepB/Spo0J family partition protein
VADNTPPVQPTPAPPPPPTPKPGTLRALIGKMAADGPAANLLQRAPDGAAARLDLDLLDANPFQPRQQMDPEKLSALADSILRDGLLHAVVVRRVPSPSGDRWQLIAGHRRTAAFRLLWERAATDEERSAFATIPAQEKLGLNDEMMGRLALVENEHREDLSPVEKAAGYAAHQQRYGLPTEALSERMSLPLRTMQRYLQLHCAPQALKDLLVQGRSAPTAPVGPGRPSNEVRHLELHGSVEFVRLFEHWKRTRPKQAEKDTLAAVARATEEGWGFRRIHDFVEASIAGKRKKASRAAAQAPLFTLTERQLLVHLHRLAESTEAEKADLRRAMQQVLGLLG